MAAILEENKTKDSIKYKVEDIYDISKEKALLKSYVDIALAPSDSTWTKSKTKNPKLLIDYKYLANDNLCTIRGQSIIPNASVNTYYEFSESGYDDAYAWEKQCDPMCTENRCVKSIDINHEIVYGSYDSGLFVISPRDFCYIKARYKLKDYKGPNNELYDISCTLCYSIDEKHPFYLKPKSKHVRAILKYSGYVFMENKTNNKNNECKAAYIVYLDPCGWIPTWVVNLVAPDQGMVIKAMVENWRKVPILLNKRKENGYKKDNQSMFAEPKDLTNIIIDDKEQKEEKNDDNINNDIGGWKKAEATEIFDAANAIKNDVEIKANIDEKNEFKIFEVVSGTKQVVAGMNFKIKIKVDDDRFIQVLVFRSLPP
eukprot:499448_1